eukprot:augustus_masked-scaffold_32-processed-gene-2.51-mRNA-1 protein AED:0.14 eAED:0.15 QI:0/-1/0/1/-1/1/1/0/633
MSENNEGLTADGLTGLPVFLEIFLTLVILLTSIKYINPSIDAKQNIKHLALPAFVLTTVQKAKVSKLILPKELLTYQQNSKHTKQNFFETFKSPRKKSYKRQPIFKLTEKNVHRFNQITPVCVFVNTKSGGQRGELLLFQLRSLLPKYQVYDLIKDGGPERGLSFFKQVPNFQVLVCGGDGSISWVLNTIDKLEFDYKPSVAILPLGTGNDMAQVLGWGTGAQSAHVFEHLLCLTEAKPVLLDRWRISFRDAKKEYAKKLNSVRNSSGDLAEKESEAEDTVYKVMNNYIGIGVDAQIAMNFHLQREKKPHLFTNRFLNKIWYTGSGAKEILMQRFLDFSTKITLFCDGAKVKVPFGIEGIIILNIRSYGGGVDLWGDAEASSRKQTDEAKMRKSYFDLSSNGNLVDRRRKSLNAADFRKMKLTRNTVTGLNGMYAKDTNERSLRDIQLQGANVLAYDVTAGKKKSFFDSDFNDQLVEVVGVQSSFQLGAAQVGLARPLKLCQGSHVVVHLSHMEECPVQIDGEPFTINKPEPNLNSKLRRRTSKDPLDKIIEVGYLNNTVMLSLLKKFKDEIDEEVDEEPSDIIKDTFLQVLGQGVNEGIISEEQYEKLERKFNLGISGNVLKDEGSSLRNRL